MSVDPTHSKCASIPRCLLAITVVALTTLTLLVALKVIKLKMGRTKGIVAFGTPVLLLSLISCRADTV